MGTPGQDQLRLASLSLASANDVRAAGVQAGADFVIDAGAGATITLVGVKGASLTDGNFVFG